MEDLEMQSCPASPNLRTALSEASRTPSAPDEPERTVQFLKESSCAHNDTPIRIIIADRQRIFRESLRVLLQRVEGFEVVDDCCDVASTLDVTRKLKPKILLLEHNLMRDEGTDLVAKVKAGDPLVKVVVLCLAITQEETVLALRSGVSGIVPKTEPSNALVECIHKVMLGEYWLGSEGIQRLVQALSNSAAVKLPAKNRFGLTAREIEIVRAVLDGYSNPEIAANFSLSQQTVKHHLSHVFDKLGVYSRLELALFAINHSVVAE